MDNVQHQLLAAATTTIMWNLQIHPTVSSIFPILSSISGSNKHRGSKHLTRLRSIVIRHGVSHESGPLPWNRPIFPDSVWWVLELRLRGGKLPRKLSSWCDWTAAAEVIRTAVSSNSFLTGLHGRKDQLLWTLIVLPAFDHVIAQREKRVVQLLNRCAPIDFTDFSFFSFFTWEAEGMMGGARGGHHYYPHSLKSSWMHESIAHHHVVQCDQKSEGFPSSSLGLFSLLFNRSQTFPASVPVLNIIL